VQFQALTPEQAEDLDAVAAQIIPTDDLPGAREARAVVFIDRALATFQSEEKPAMLEGLADLNRRARGRFSGVSETRQRELLQEIEDGEFFAQVRLGVVVGTFAHPSWGGNVDGAGWRILGFEPRYFWRPPFGAYDAEEMGR
jgi:gluconate 2-dehydrogenase gamma chain